MAKKPNTYKYIDTDIDSDLLLTNLKHNAQNYVKFKNWDNSKAQEFYAALSDFEKAIEEKRLSSDQSGNIIDTKGILNNGGADWRDKNGNVLSQEQYDSLKERNKKNVSKDFFANREVATYLGTIAKSLYNQETSKDKSEELEKLKFNFSKHGLWNKFANDMAPSGVGDIEAWLDADPYDEKTKKRKTVNRAKLFSDYITKYITELPEDTNFSDTVFKTRENYIQKLQTLQKELANGVNSVDYRLINQIGGTPEEYRRFFTTDKEYLPPNTEPVNSDGNIIQEPSNTPTTPQTSSNNSEDELKTNAELKALDTVYRNRYDNSKPMMYRIKSGPRGVKYDTRASDQVRAYMNALNAKNIDFSVNKLKAAIGKEYQDYLEQYQQMNPSAFDTINSGIYNGWYYIPESLNTDNFTVLGFNPETHYVARIFYGSIDGQAREHYKELLKQLNTGSKPKHQEGGNITVFTNNSSGGSAEAFSKRQQELSKETKSNPKNRQPGKTENNYSNTDFTTTDYVRLGAIGADIAALVDPEPFSAAGLGYASDVANLGADIAEGQGAVNTIGNFLGNAALSTIGIIPVIGDAVGSGSKIVKNLIKFVPKLGKAVLAASAVSALSNSDEILKSIGKIGKDGPENEMNVQDWRNVSIAIQLALGSRNAFKNRKAIAKVRKAGETNFIDAKVKQNSTNTEKILRFGGKEDVEALRNATTPDEVLAVINGHPSLKGKYTPITTQSVQKGWSVTKPNWYKPWNWRQKTTTDVLTSNTISPVYSRNIAMSAPMSWFKREKYIAKYSKDSPAPYKSVKRNSKAVKPTKPSKPTNSPTTANTGMSLGMLNDNELIKRAKMNSFFLNSIPNRPHSSEWNELAKRGYDESRLTSLGLWKQGGRLVRKAQGGMYTVPSIKPLTVPTLDDILSKRFNRKPFGMNVNGHLVELPNTKKPFGINSRPRNYGTGYTSSLDYSNKEYGTTNKVSLSQIQRSNAGLRSKTLYPVHGNKEYDFTDAQANTDRARTKWQANAENRTNDFLNWVTNWRKSNPNGTQADMIGAYNTLIDKMYKYKREMATPEYSGEHSYRHGDAVRDFNRTNRSIYASANTYPQGVNGYSPEQESWNGSTTAQRFIDITPEDIKDLKFNFAEDASEDFKDLFRNLVKDATGRYYIDTPDIPQWLQVPQSTQSLVNPAEDIQPSKDKPKTKINLEGVISEALPNALTLGRYFAARNLNKNLYDITKQMPVELYNPMEAHKWLLGDEQAVMAGRRMAGKLNHLTSRPVTSDANQMQAAQMEGYIKGNEYLLQGEAQDAAKREATAEAEWQQERANQKSRYESSATNKHNLLAKRVSVLQAQAAKERADYESLNGLLGQFEVAARQKNEETAALRESAEKASLQNDISANMENYGIPVTTEDQQLMNDLLTGTRDLNSLNDNERKTYERLSNAIQEEVSRRIFASKGIVYKPFTPQTTNTVYKPTIVSNNVPKERQGGVLYGDSEKITIQKLRGRIRRMEIFQRHLASRMNAFERDMDRTQRSASQYINGQKRQIK
nr:MAG TPA: hypothetical protein [Caudoviricetes sp.]